MEHPATQFRQIYSEYSAQVYNLALSYLMNSEDAEEVTQDVFIKVHKSLGSFKSNSTLKTWIYRITINQCLDFIKHKSSKKLFFVFGRKSSSEKEYLNAGNFEHPGIVLENKEKAALLYSVINTLPESQKTAFLLSKSEGLSNPEIAELMDVTVSAVESLLVRAKKALREKLADKFEEYSRKK